MLKSPFQMTISSTARLLISIPSYEYWNKDGQRERKLFEKWYSDKKKAFIIFYQQSQKESKQEREGLFKNEEQEREHPTPPHLAALRVTCSWHTLIIHAADCSHFSLQVLPLEKSLNNTLLIGCLLHHLFMLSCRFYNWQCKRHQINAALIHFLTLWCRLYMCFINIYKGFDIRVSALMHE